MKAVKLCVGVEPDIVSVVPWYDIVSYDHISEMFGSCPFDFLYLVDAYIYLRRSLDLGR